MKLVNVNDIAPSTYNPRVADPERLDLIELSLRKLGFLLPLYATPDGEIISGHQRHHVACRMGVSQLPVEVTRPMDLAERKGVNVVFNRATNDLGQSDTVADMTARMQASDACRFDYEPFDVAVCYLVMMFMPVGARAAFIAKLRASLKPGGAIVIVDKCEAATGYQATVLWRLTLAGKVAAGVSPEHIIAKELSLGGVQRPLDPAILGEDAAEWFRFGEFAGWIITS